MIFKRMREQILDKAIRGQLVPQLAEDGVVEQIGEAPTEVPFEIPDSWKWVKLKDVFSMQAGKFIKASEIKEAGAYPCYGGNGLRGFVDKTNRKGRFPIIGRQGALCGNIHVVDGEFYATEHAVVVDCGLYGDPDCVGLFLAHMNLNQYATATAQPGLSVKKIEELPFQLPPLAEQKRIASRVTELFTEIDRAEKAYEELQSLANILRGQILQKAIQGKLVPQLPEDGVVEQIGKTPSEVPFDIPDSWKWVKFEHTCKCLDSMRVPIKQKDRENLNKQYPYYGATGVIDYVDKYIFDGSFLLIGEDGANLLSKSKDNAFIATGKFWVNNHAHIFDSNKVSELKYLAIVINALNLNRYVTGSAQPKLTQKNLFSIPVPLPPLAEQTRIVAKVETLLEQVDLMTK